ncbi:MAG: hypothetical protein BRC48_00955 [Cyanobacteria bacterium QS_9_48_30]|nr:MAG: hypothetical protein BRC48_00955 [Cyanobacteria bacterium QS_9_48_30]
MQILFILLAVVLIICTVIFALQNVATLTIQFFIWQFQEAPFLFIVLAALVAGLVSGLLILLPAVTKNSKKSSQHRQRIRELENTLEEKDQTINNQNERVRYLENHLPGGQGSSESGQSS